MTLMPTSPDEWWQPAIFPVLDRLVVRLIGEIALARLNEVDDLTDEEWESVRDFVGYVRSRRSGR